MKIILPLLAVIVLSTSAHAGMRCKTDWNDVTTCTDSSGTTIMRCKENWNGVLVCD